MLAEGVVAAPMDIDLCLILGAGWPFHLGGITPYLDRAGVSERVIGRRFLPPGVASVPSAGFCLSRRDWVPRGPRRPHNGLDRVAGDRLRRQPDLREQFGAAAVGQELLRNAELA